MGILYHVERFLSYLLYNVRGHDDKLYTRSSAFIQQHPEPTITVTSDISASPMPLKYAQHVAYAPGGENAFPPLKISNLPENTVELVVIVEDADAPVPFVPLHGLYYGIPGSVTSLESLDFAPDTLGYKAKGIKLGKNLRSNVYGGPRPLLGHGPHRYFYQVVALGAKLEGVKEQGASLAEITAALQTDQVLGWGEWVGTYENKHQP